MKFTQAVLTVGLLILGLLCNPLMGGDVPHVEPAVRVTERGGTTGRKADNEPDATGYDPIPWGDTWASEAIGPLKIRVLTRKLNPPENHVFVQYLEDGKWYDSIPSDAHGFTVSDWKPPGPNLISVYRPFFNTEVPDADNFPWRLEGNLGGGKGGAGQLHWGAMITRPALPDDLAFVFGDRPKIGENNHVYVGLFVIPSQAIVDSLANAGDGYIITKRTQTYKRKLPGGGTEDVSEVIYYGGILTTDIFVGGEGPATIRTLDPDHTTYYPGANGTLLGGPHMMSDGRIALEYDVLINNPIDWTTQPLESPITVAIETNVFSGDPGGVFGDAVDEAKKFDHNRTGRPDENEYDHKSNAYFGKGSDENTYRDTLWNGVAGCTLRKTATCTFGLLFMPDPKEYRYTSEVIQDPPEDINLRVNRPLGLGSGRYEDADAIPKL